MSVAAHLPPTTRKWAVINTRSRLRTFCGRVRRASCVTQEYIVKNQGEKVTLIYLFHGFFVITCRSQVQSTWKLRFVNCVASTEYNLFFYLYDCAQYFYFFFSLLFFKLWKTFNPQKNQTHPTQDRKSVV